MIALDPSAADSAPGSETITSPLSYGAIQPADSYRIHFQAPESHISYHSCLEMIFPDLNFIAKREKWNLAS